MEIQRARQVAEKKDEQLNASRRILEAQEDELLVSENEISLLRVGVKGIEKACRVFPEAAVGLLGHWKRLIVFPASSLVCSRSWSFSPVFLAGVFYFICILVEALPQPTGMTSYCLMWLRPEMFGANTKPKYELTQLKFFGGWYLKYYNRNASYRCQVTSSCRTKFQNTSCQKLLQRTNIWSNGKYQTY